MLIYLKANYRNYPVQYCDFKEIAGYCINNMYYRYLLQIPSSAMWLLSDDCINHWEILC